MTGNSSKSIKRASGKPFAGEISMLVVLCLVIHLCHQKTNELLTAASTGADASPIPSAQTVKLVSLGYDQLIADVYWLAFIQYIGDGVAREKDKGPLAVPYLDLITELDPHFMQAYWFAAFVVGGEQKSPKLAAEILERGLRENTDTWYMPFIAGINQYLYAKNEPAAARYYRMAAKYEGAPKWLERQASILEAKIPSMIKEINIWTNVYESAEESRVKEHAKERLINLWVTTFKNSPTEEIRKRAKNALLGLGVDVDRLTQPK